MTHCELGVVKHRALGGLCMTCMGCQTHCVTQGAAVVIEYSVSTPLSFVDTFEVLLAIWN